MKRLMTLLIVLMSCALLVDAQSANVRKFKHDDKIVVNYDKSKNLTTIFLKSNLKDSNSGVMDEVIRVDLLAGFTFEGEKTTGIPQVVELAFEIIRSKKRVDKLNIPELTAKVDGEEINLGKPRLIGTATEEISEQVVRLSFLTERLAIRLPVNVFQKIASGKKVILQSGDVKLKLKDKNLEALRDLISRIE